MGQIIPFHAKGATTSGVIAFQIQNFRLTLLTGGVEIISEIVRSDRADFLWRFKDADQDLEPMCATLVFKADELSVEDEVLEVVPDAPAIFARVVECPAFVPPLSLHPASFGLERNCAVAASCASCPVLAARLGNVEVEFSIPLEEEEIAAVA